MDECYRCGTTVSLTLLTPHLLPEIYLCDLCWLILVPEPRSSGGSTSPAPA